MKPVRMILLLPSNATTNQNFSENGQTEPNERHNGVASKLGIAHGSTMSWKIFEARGYKGHVMLSLILENAFA
jgi:hypothetical protein